MAGGRIVSDRTSEFLEAVRSESCWRIVGAGTQDRWISPSDAGLLSTLGHDGIVELSAADRMATIRAGSRLATINEELAEFGLMIPTPAGQGTVGGLVAMGLPHRGEAMFGPVRDWVLGMAVLLADGRVVQVGSRVAKSVAGFDIHRTMVGSRGGLGLILQVHLRVFPAGEVPPPWADERVGSYSIRRTSPAQFDSEICNAEGLLSADAATATYALSGPITANRPGWWIGPQGSRSEPTNRELERKLKHVMDPKNVWEEGWR